MGKKAENDNGRSLITVEEVVDYVGISIGSRHAIFFEIAAKFIEFLIKTSPSENIQEMPNAGRTINKSNN